MRKVWMSLGRVAALIMGLAGAVSAQTVTIAALGDSLTQGYGLAPQDGFVAQLEARLKAQGRDVTLINAGVSGDTSQGGAARVGWTLTPDVDALIVALGANDVLRGVDPAVTRANLDQILQTAGAAGVEVLLMGFAAPGNYGADYKAQFDAIYPDLAQAHGVALADSFFAGFGARADDPAQLAALLQPDGLHPNATGVALIVDGLVADVTALADRAR